MFSHKSEKLTNEIQPQQIVQISNTMMSVKSTSLLFLFGVNAVIGTNEVDPVSFVTLTLCGFLLRVITDNLNSFFFIFFLMKLQNAGNKINDFDSNRM